MHENENIADTLINLCVSIKVSNGLGGSGILYQSKEIRNAVYLITAKHCLKGEDFKGNPKLEDISIRLYNREEINLPITSQIFYHSSEDICSIRIDKNYITPYIENIPEISLVIDNSGELSCTMYGFPVAFPGNQPVRINGKILPPIFAKTVWVDTNVESERNLTEFTVKGLSGSGLGLICSGEVYLLGIVTNFEEWKRFKCCSILAFLEILLHNEDRTEPVIKIETNPEVIAGCKSLNNNTDDILRSIDDRIASIHLSRSELLEKAETLLLNNDVVMVLGSAGSGKSTLTKELLSKSKAKDGTKIITLSGGQICRNSLTELLASLNISLQLDNLLTSKDLLGNKLIYIDSAEKAIESNLINVLKDLLLLPKTHKGVKVIISIRSYALTQTAFSLVNDLDVSRAKLEVGVLSDIELKPLLDRYPKIQELLLNKKVESLVRTPFYLKQIIGILGDLDSKDLDERQLKVTLWNKVVSKENLNRELLFQKIAIERATQLIPFVKIIEPVENTILRDLLSDNIIVERLDHFGIREFAPSHDIFEDWALVRHISQAYSQSLNVFKFLSSLSSAYAIQRGFRFWLQELYRVDHPQAVQITLDVILSSGLDKWKNEVITALLNSSICSDFLKDNSQLLLDNNARLLIKCIHLIRTTCKITGSKTIDPALNRGKSYLSSETLLPAGPGWLSVINFINDNYDTLRSKNVNIIFLLMDWKIGLEGETVKPAHGPALLVNKLLNDYLENGEEGVFFSSQFIDELIILLFLLTETDPVLVQTFLERSLHYFQERQPGQPSAKKASTRELHKKVLNTAISWRNSKQVCKHFPEIIIDIANKKWIHPLEEETIIKGPGKSIRSAYHSLPDNVLDVTPEELFGLQSEYKRSFNPASAFQTPLPHLLEYHTDKAISFIISLLNGAFKRASLHPLRKGKGLTTVTIISETGEKYTQFGNEEIWEMHRGNSRTPALLQSIVMALEKFLIEFKQDSQKDKDKWLGMLNWLLRDSNNVGITAAVTTACISSPFISIDIILRLLRTKEIIVWDFFRFSRERDYFHEISFYDKPFWLRKERLESQKAVVRKIYLESLAFKLSLYEGYSEKILSIIDGHIKENESNPDLESPWQYILRRMDRRNYNFTPIFDDESYRILIEPKIEVFGNSSEQENEFQVSPITVWSWCDKILEKGIQEDNTIAQWRNYLGISKRNIEVNSFDNALFNAPANLASIGLRWHLTNLEEAELIWCVNIIIDTSKYFIQQESKLSEFGKLGKYSINNKDAALTTLPLLFSLKLDQEQHKEVETLLLSQLFTMDISGGLDKPLFEAISKSFWTYNAELAYQCFRTFLTLASLETVSWKVVPSYIEVALDKKISARTTYVFGNQYLSRFFANKAYLFISQNSKIDEEGAKFIETYLNFLIMDTFKQRSRGYTWEETGSKYHEGYYHFYSQFGNIVLDQPALVAHAIFRQLLGYFLIEDGGSVEHITKETLEFGNECLTAVIKRQDLDPKSERFNVLWRILCVGTISCMRAIFLKHLLLNIDWKDSATKWSAVEESPELFARVIQTLGSFDPQSSIKLISGIGFESLFPNSIFLLGGIIDSSIGKQMNDVFWLNSYDCEKFIQRAFFLKGHEIRPKAEMRNEFIKILDAMIERGSSIAFLVKENIASVN